MRMPFAAESRSDRRRLLNPAPADQILRSRLLRALTSRRLPCCTTSPSPAP